MGYMRFKIDIPKIGKISNYNVRVFNSWFYIGYIFNTRYWI